MSVGSQQASDRFPTTHWSMVSYAGRVIGEERRRALEAMLPRYLPALRSYLLYSRRLPAEVCDDILQAFVAEKILERNLFGAAQRERGRFRAFLITTIDHFASNYLRSDRAHRQRVQACEDLEIHAPVEHVAPGAAFDIAWARELLREALARMECECRDKKRQHVWQIFEARTLLPLLEDREPVPYQELVERYGFVSPTQATNALVTANRMFRRILRGIISTYAESEEEVDEEIRQLHQILSSAGARPGGLRV